MAARDSKTFNTTQETEGKFLLWPIFIIELLSLVIWAPIAALAGMGYTPSFSWGNVCLIVFHLYPIYILVAILVALSLREYGKIELAVLVAISPPLLSGAGFLALLIYAKGH
jgi:hypothetical protein